MLLGLNNLKIRYYGNLNIFLTEQLHFRGVVAAGDGHLALDDPVNQISPLPRAGVLPQLDLIRLHVDVDEEDRRVGEGDDAAQTEPRVDVHERPPVYTGEPSSRGTFHEKFGAGASLNIMDAAMYQKQILGFDDPRDVPPSQLGGRGTFRRRHVLEVVLLAEYQLRLWTDPLYGPVV